jgi:hypothetical protein
MIRGEIKSKIDLIWEDFWTGGITNSISVLEQMTYLFFIATLVRQLIVIDNIKEEIRLIRKLWSLLPTASASFHMSCTCRRKKSIAD